jgi:hypothetical protein
MSSSRSYTETINTLRERWKDQGILNEQPATEAEIEAFEAHHNVVLPPDLRFYFLTVNGTRDGRISLDDEHMIGFWHLDQVVTFAEENAGGGMGNPDALRTFAIADQLIWSFGFGVQFSSDAAATTLIVSDGGTNHIYPVTASFTEFIEGYLRNDLRIIYADPPEELQAQLNAEREASQRRTLENLNTAIDKAKRQRESDSDNQ